MIIELRLTSQAQGHTLFLASPGTLCLKPLLYSLLNGALHSCYSAWLPVSSSLVHSQIIMMPYCIVLKDQLAAQMLLPGMHTFCQNQPWDLSNLVLMNHPISLQRHHAHVSSLKTQLSCVFTRLRWYSHQTWVMMVKHRDHQRSLEGLFSIGSSQRRVWNWLQKHIDLCHAWGGGV